MNSWYFSLIWKYIQDFLIYVNNKSFIYFLFINWNSSRRDNKEVEQNKKNNTESYYNNRVLQEQMLIKNYHTTQVQPRVV